MAVRVYSGKLDSQLIDTIRVYSLAASTDGENFVRVFRASVEAAEAITAGDDQEVSPYSTVTLTASSGTWSQLSGPSVTLVGSGNVVTFRAPGRQTEITLVFEASNSGSSATTQVVVSPASEYSRSNNQWVGRQTFTRSGSSWI